MEVSAWLSTLVSMIRVSHDLPKSAALAASIPAVSPSECPPRASLLPLAWLGTDTPRPGSHRSPPGKLHGRGALPGHADLPSKIAGLIIGKDLISDLHQGQSELWGVLIR